MAMTATITQPRPAIAGQPTYFILNVANSGVSQVSVNSVQQRVTNPAGGNLPGMPFNLGIVTAQGVSPSVPQQGGSQFNVPVPGGGSVNFSFTIQFYGPLVTGTATQPQSQFLVSADIMTSDGSVFNPVPAPIIDLNTPIWGQPGSPPNIVPLTGQLNFSTLANSGLAL